MEPDPITLREPDRTAEVIWRGRTTYEMRFWREHGYVAWVLLEPSGKHLAWGGRAKTFGRYWLEPACPRQLAEIPHRYALKILEGWADG